MEIKTIQDIEAGIEEHSLTLEEKALKQLNGVIESSPLFIKNLIEEAYEHQRIPKEYLLGSILFAYSNAAGLAFELDAMGYKNYGNIYMALIGSRGDVKSPAMDIATEPLNKYDNDQYSIFLEKSKDSNGEDDISRKQLFIQDATVEAAYYMHFKNPFSAGIYVDELYHLIDKMSNPASKDGPAWRTLLLQGSTNKHVDISRKTTDSFRLAKSYPVLLGSIQSEFIPKIFSGGNLESGLVDRLLFTEKLTHNKKLSKQKIDREVLKVYSDNLLRIMDHRNQVEISHNFEEINRLKCSKSANERLFTYSQKLIDLQENSNNMEKGYIAKMLINIHKLTILLHLIKESSTPELCLEVNLQTVEEAIKVIDFYFTNFKIVLSKLDGKSVQVKTEEVIKLGIENKATQEQIASVLGVNKSTISRKMQKLNATCNPQLPP